MKVLFISNDPLLFDPASAVRSRMRTYAASVGDLHILSSAPRSAREEKDGSLVLHPVHTSKLFRIHTLARHARKIIHQYNIEIVSAQDPFEHGLAALKAVKGTSAKLHIQVHTDFLSPWFVLKGNWRSPQIPVPFMNYLRLKIAERVLPMAYGIRVVSERVKASLITHFGSRIVEPAVIPVLVNATVPDRVQLPPHSFTFTLMTASRLEPEKRIEDVLAAMRLIVGKYPMIGLFIVGEGRERTRLEDMVQELGLRGKVIFLGHRNDAWGLMHSAHAYVQASAYEGYGRSLIEAALAKTPIITTDVGIVGEVFRGYEDVLSVPVADPTALSLAIIGAIEDTSVREALPFHAQATARAYLESLGDIPARIAQNLAETIAS